MLNAFYKILYVMTADLRTPFWGPYINVSQDDVKLVEDFLISGDTTAVNRGFFAEGDGFVPSMANTSAETATFLSNFLGVELRAPSYLAESGNTDSSPDLQSTDELDPDGRPDRYGLQDACTIKLAVLDRTSGLAAETADASYYEDFGSGSPYVAGVLKHFTHVNPWLSLVDGFSPARLGTPNLVNTVGRNYYFQAVYEHVFAPIATIACLSDVAVGDAVARDYLRIANNGSAFRMPELRFGLRAGDRVKVQLFDVAGRHVRTLADRRFAAGDHVLAWDGADDRGARVARGVYFVRVERASGEEVARKIVLLH